MSWVAPEDWARFVTEAAVLEEARRGRVVVPTGDFPDQFEAEIAVVDRAGHVVVRGSIAAGHAPLPSAALTFAFDLLPDRLPANRARPSRRPPSGVGLTAANRGGAAVYPHACPGPSST